jgi:CheY-like chemotaxis protein
MYKRAFCLGFQELQMSKKKILLVDDELMLLLSMQRMLEDDYDITIVVGGRKALNVITKQHGNFDLIISDIFMPDVDGVKLYHHVMKDYPDLAKHMILMTGAHLTPEIESFIGTTDNVCISKPFEHDQLLQTIKELLNSSS